MSISVINIGIYNYIYQKITITVIVKKKKKVPISPIIRRFQKDICESLSMLSIENLFFYTSFRLEVYFFSMLSNICKIYYHKILTLFISYIVRIYE
jgi:hypothetical protein